MYSYFGSNWVNTTSKGGLMFLTFCFFQVVIFSNEGNDLCPALCMCAMNTYTLENFFKD